MGVYNYNLNTNPAAASTLTGTVDNSTASVPARVVDVILDSSHKEYNKYGKSRSIGVIKYRLLSKAESEENSAELHEAYPISSTLKRFPLKNEIVLLVKAPSDELDTSSANQRTYYDTIVNIWNHPNHGGFPEGSILDLGDGIEELIDVNPMTPFPGDVILDGRQGQSLRMTGLKSNSNPFTDGNNQGKPLTIISNGQKTAENSYDPIIEDVNEDASSMYLASDHAIPLNEANNRRKSYDKVPTSAKEYKGSQVLINGGRLYFNAKSESAFISAAESVGLSANTLNFDANKHVCIDSPAVYLGSNAKNNEQPVIKGDKLESFLADILNVLETLSKGMQNAATVSGEPIPLLIQAGSNALLTIQTNLRREINPGGTSPLKSKKIFTE